MKKKLSFEEGMTELEALVQAQMQIQPGSLSEVLSKVESAGLVERRRCEDDRRNFEIRLTAQGVQQAEAFEQDRRDMAGLLFQTLDDGEKQALRRDVELWKGLYHGLLDKLIQAKGA